MKGLLVTLQKYLFNLGHHCQRETLENLLICKLNPQGHCYEQQFDKAFLKRAKSATVNDLQKKK